MKPVMKPCRYATLLIRRMPSEKRCESLQQTQLSAMKNAKVSTVLTLTSYILEFGVFMAKAIKSGRCTGDTYTEADHNHPGVHILKTRYLKVL